MGRGIGSKRCNRSKEGVPYLALLLGSAENHALVGRRLPERVRRASNRASRNESTIS